MRKILYILVGLALSILIIIPIYIYDALYSPASDFDRPVTVTIERGSDFKSITRTLVKAGVLTNDRGFKIAARIKGAHRKIHAGEYDLRGGMTPVEILSAMTTGRVKSYNLTIPEGYTLKDVSQAVEAAGFAKARDFITQATGENLTKALGFEGSSLEGYLFPDTYRITRLMKPADIISMMTARFKEVYNSQLQAETLRLGFTKREIITLASIIEKETGTTAEMGKISAVFHNRLRRGIGLQSDPTVIYGIKDFNGNLTRKDLRHDTPYNTYVHRGLPPGPIANPGKEAINAALNPAKVDYLYFVSRNDGTHYFSKTLKEHNRAVEKYQKRRRRKR